MGWYHGQIAEGVDPFEDNAVTNTTPITSVPKLDKIYHLCQKSNWTKAVASGEPYFPPTFVSDGRFTRASQEKDSLVGTANTYYKETSGEWICLELDANKLKELGLQILPQCAPEGTVEQPVNCLQIFGGITTTVQGVVTSVFPITRLGDGTFYSIGNECHKTPKMLAPPTPPPPTPPVECATQEVTNKPKKKEKRRFFGRKSSKS